MGVLKKMFRLGSGVSGQRIVPAEALEKRRYLVKKTLCGF